MVSNTLQIVYHFKLVIVVHVHTGQVVQITNVDHQLHALRGNRMSIASDRRKASAMQVKLKALRSNVIVGLAVEQHKQHVRMVGCDSLGQQLSQDVRRANQCGGRDELLGAHSDTYTQRSETIKKMLLFLVNKCIFLRVYHQTLKSYRDVP